MDLSRWMHAVLICTCASAILAADVDCSVDGEAHSSCDSLSDFAKRQLALEEAFSSGDIPGVIDMLHEDVIYDQLNLALGLSGRYYGQEGATDMFSKFGAQGQLTMVPKSSHLYADEVRHKILTKMESAQKNHVTGESGSYDEWHVNEWANGKVQKVVAWMPDTESKNTLMRLGQPKAERIMEDFLAAWFTKDFDKADSLLMRGRGAAAQPLVYPAPDYAPGGGEYASFAELWSNVLSHWDIELEHYEPAIAIDEACLMEMTFKKLDYVPSGTSLLASDGSTTLRILGERNADVEKFDKVTFWLTPDPRPLTYHAPPQVRGDHTQDEEEIPQNNVSERESEATRTVWMAESGAKVIVEAENGLADLGGILYTKAGDRAIFETSTVNSAEVAPYWPLDLIKFTDEELEFGALFARENSIELPLPIEKYWRSFVDMPTMLVSMYPKLKKSEVWIEKGDGESAGTIVSYPSTNTGSVHITDRLKLELLHKDDATHTYEITIPEPNAELSYYRVKFTFDEPTTPRGRPRVTIYIEVKAVRDTAEARKPGLAVSEMVTYKRLTDMSTYVLRDEGLTVQASKIFENVNADEVFEKFSDWENFSYFVAPRIKSAKHIDFFRRVLKEKRGEDIVQELVAVDPARKTVVFQDYWTGEDVYGGKLSLSLSSYTMQPAGESSEHTQLTHTLTFMAATEGEESKILPEVRSRIAERLEKMKF